MILCVGNGGFASSESGLHENRHTARFVVNLARNAGSVAYCQPAVEVAEWEPVSGDNLSRESNVALLAVRLWRKSALTKLLSYVFALPRLVREVRNADSLYLFMPGNVSFICGLLSIIFGKSYGVYLRGEFSMAGSLARAIVSRAKFALVAGADLRAKARQLCRDVELVTPMLDLTPNDIATDRCQREAGPWRLLYVGRIEERKGIRELLDAAGILHKDGLDFELNLAGGGEDSRHYETSLAPELRRKVNFLGAVGDRKRLFRLYQQADVFLFPSHDEGFPRVLYEAMAFGTPIVTTFVGGIPSLMVDRVNCVRINVGDSRSIVSRTAELLGNVKLRRSIAANAAMCVGTLLRTWEGRSHAEQVSAKLVHG